MKSNLPYNVMRHRDWDVAPRAPAVAAFLFPAIIAGGGLGALLVTAAVSLAISAVTSWALQALAPKPKMGVGTQGLITNLRDAAAPREYVYGQVRKGGVITYLESTGSQNKFLHMIIAVAGHRVEEIGDIFINDEIVTINPSTNLVTSAPWNSKIRIQKFLGNQTTAPASLVSASTKVDGNFIGRGIAYLYVRLEYDQDVFAGGIPLFSAVIKGKRVFDPRTSTTAYSANAALCIRDYLAFEYGMNDVGSINETVFSAAANICDEDIRLSTIVNAGSFIVGQQYEILTVGTTNFTAVGASANTVGVVFVATGVGSGTGTAHESQNRYEMNGVISAALSPGDILQSMMTCCAGTLFWGQGKWQLRVGSYSPPVKDFGLEDLRGPISLSTRTSRRDNFNIVRGTFNNAEARYITQDYPEFKGAAFIAEDNGLENALDLMLPLTTDPAMVQRLAKLTLFRGREQMTFSADFSVAAFDVQVGDIISLTNPRYGFVEKDFEVLGWRFFASEDAGDLRVKLDLRETSEAAFDWNAEESAIINNNTALPSAFRPVPFGLDLTSEVRIVNEHLTNVIFASVTSSEPFNIERVEVQFKKSNETGFKVAGVGDLGVYEILDTEDATHDVRARTYSVLGVRSDFEIQTGFVVAGLANPPADVTGLTAEINGASVHLEWEPVPDLDLSFYRIRHAVEETGASWANATTSVDKVPRPANSVTVPAKPGTYMIRAFDKTKNASLNYTEVTVPAAALEGFATTLTQTDDPTFTGAKTGCSVDSGSLIITDVTGTPPFLATYELSDYIDTGAVRRFRSRIDVSNTRQDNSAGLWDDIPGLFDTLPGNFDDFTGDAQFADTNIVTYIATTNTDPAGTPTWTDFQKFRAGDFFARAAKFKIELISNSINVTPSVAQLDAIVEHN